MWTRTCGAARSASTSSGASRSHPSRWAHAGPWRGGMARHVAPKTGALALPLKEAGAQVRLASCNPLSTDDAVVAALRDEGLETYAKKWETNEEYDEYLHKVL